MAEFVLPRYVTWPEPEITSTGDFRKDLGAALDKIATELEAQAKATALRRVFGHDAAGNVPQGNPTYLSIAAGTLREVIDLMDKISVYPQQSYKSSPLPV
jgi:hypothetical protein